MIKIVADAGAIASGQLVRMLESGELGGAGIILPSVVLDELYARASTGDSAALRTLEGVLRLQGAASAASATVRVYAARRPWRPTDGGAAIANEVRDVALENGATLYTADATQVLSAKAAGIPSRLCEAPRTGDDPWFARYFDDSTMSVHLKEGMRPAAKRGTPSDVSLVELGDEILTRQDLDGMLAALDSMAGQGNGADMSLPGAMVIQHDKYRIVATHMPFSEAREITIVRPTIAIDLGDYDMPDALRERLEGSADGILVSGAPGSGKSTLASALANHYNRMHKTVKTLESPRDLQLDTGITQYSRLDGDFANTADVLLLVRPDYTIFDEVRRREDFAVFADLRLSGVGMIGVVHASSPLDAVQRFIGRIELGVIPHVIDTVVFVNGGKAQMAYSLSMRVKVPSGMAEQDLARPVIEVKDIETGKPAYEIYAFGEENMVVPVEEGAGPSGVGRLAAERARQVMTRFDDDPLVEIVSAGSIRVGVSKPNIASIIGRGGSNIGALERELGVHIDVVERSAMGAEQTESPPTDSSSVDFEMSESHAFVVFWVDRRHSGSHADLYSGTELAASSRVDSRGRIRLPRRSSGAREILEAHSEGNARVVIRPS